MLLSAEIWDQTWHIFFELQNVQKVPLSTHLQPTGHLQSMKAFIYIIYNIENFSDFHLTSACRQKCHFTAHKKKKIYLPKRNSSLWFNIIFLRFLLKFSHFSEKIWPGETEKNLIFTKKTNCSNLLLQIKHLRTALLCSYLDWRNCLIDAHLNTHGIVWWCFSIIWIITLN